MPSIHRFLPTPSRFRRTLLAAAAGLAMVCQTAQAAYPDHPITMIVPFAAGGPTDVVGRIMAKFMGQELGQSVVVENRTGAGGMIGIETIRRAAPDGYTVGIAPASTHGVASNIYTRINYDPVGDFEAIGQLVKAPGVLIASPATVPDCKLPAFLAQLKAKPEGFRFGSAGVGSLSHMTGEQFLVVTGTTMLHVPYRGLAPAMTDLYGGQIDAIFDNVSSALPHIQGGKVCALAVQSDQRLPSLPDVPTYAELGLNDMNHPTWFGLIAPKGVPTDVVKTLNTALNKALALPEVREAYARLSVVPVPTTPAEFSQTIKNEITHWKEITDKSNFQKIPL